MGGRKKERQKDKNDICILLVIHMLDCIALKIIR